MLYLSIKDIDFEAVFSLSIVSDAINFPVFSSVLFSESRKFENIVPKVFSEWDKNLKHFNSHVWPGTDSILVAYVSDEQAKEIMRVIKMIKIDLGKMISMGAVVIPVEDIIL